jgi:hypothetical protein
MAPLKTTLSNKKTPQKSVISKKVQKMVNEQAFRAVSAPFSFKRAQLSP